MGFAIIMKSDSLIISFNIFFLGLETAGYYAPCSHPQVSNHLTLLSDSLPTSDDEQSSTESTSHGNRNKCPVPIRSKALVNSRNKIQQRKAVLKSSGRVKSTIPYS
ncbi:unnamed protein product [Brassica rapa subsp. trilocularis]|uniref:(rape) hypothetical protein n=1 Tax=Brassica napus TaxID=3708 RepID=A0A816T5T2_BRANA|nr:unnamed protein product [Brassica napus]